LIIRRSIVGDIPVYIIEKISTKTLYLFSLFYKYSKPLYLFSLFYEYSKPLYLFSKLGLY
jgi:hypothetical protein